MKTTLSVVLLLLSTLACSSEPAATPAETCRQIASAWCDRYYECFSPEQIDQVGLPLTAADCARDRELAARCDEITDANACAAGLDFDPSAVGACVDGIRGSGCSQLDDDDAIGQLCEPLCTAPTTACATERCDPAAPGCGEGACRLDEGCGARCQPDVGEGDALAWCASDADCAEGHTCLTDLHLCVELCNQAHPCGDGRACIGVEHPDAGVSECSDGCRPGHVDCPGSLTCVVDVSQGVSTWCTPAGATGEGGFCTRTDQCAVPLQCIPDADGDGHCRQFCDVWTPCSGVRDCVLYDPPLVYDGTSLGVCL